MINRLLISTARSAVRARTGQVFASVPQAGVPAAARYLSSTVNLRNDKKNDKADTSKKAPESLLTDDLLESAGLGMEKENASSKAGEESSESAGGSNKHWENTARKSTDKSSTQLKREKRSNFFLAMCLGAAVGGFFYLGRDWDSEEERKRLQSEVENGIQDTPYRAAARLSGVFQTFKDPVFDKLLPDPLPEPYSPPLTLVVGLEDVLVHSEWTREHGWRTAKRPGVDYFLGYLAQYYEIVLFSDRYLAYAEKTYEKLDPYKALFSYALYREGTLYKDGKIIKDLSKINRDLSKVIMLDCSEDAYSLQRDNAVPISAWKGNADDRELVKLIPFFEWIATQPLKDVRPILKSFENAPGTVADEYARREAIARAKFEEEYYKESSKNDWASSFLGVKSKAPQRPMMPQDYIRQEGQKRYEAIQKEIALNGEKMLKQEKEILQEISQEQKFTLSKLVTEGLPSQEEMAAAAAAKAAERQQKGSA